MKLNKMYLLCGILFLLILFCCLGSCMREGLDTHQVRKNYDENKKDSITEFEKNNNNLLQSDGVSVLPYDGDNNNSALIGPGGEQQKQGAESEGDYIKQVHKRNSPYDNSSQGIPKNQIPKGDEDLYILKSEVVPPVCPVCPPVLACDSKDDSKCQPCPPCARCPEPAFECKKVPNYNTNDDDYLPRPVLTDFSQFGM